MMIDFDKHCLCPHCGNAMEVLIPIWITPGEDLALDGIVYESGMKDRAENWYCQECEAHHFPRPQDPELSTPDSPECSECGRVVDRAVLETNGLNCQTCGERKSRCQKQSPNQ